MIESYPLTWPQGWQRTLKPSEARFSDKTIGYARDRMLSELNRLGAKNIVISSDLKLRNDGLPYSSQRQPDDKGVAVYFDLKNDKQCFPCDRWNYISDNMWAIVKSIEAIRGLERWGAKDMVNAAFKGFKALPNYTSPAIRYFDGCIEASHIKSRYRDLVKKLHTDVGGDLKEFQEMQRQYDEIKTTL